MDDIYTNNPHHQNYEHHRKYPHTNNYHEYNHPFLHCHHNYGGHSCKMEFPLYFDVTVIVFVNDEGLYLSFPPNPTDIV